MAILAHRFSDGSEHPITFASRALAPAERNYSQLDKEGLAIIFGVERFHKFLFGRQFTIFTDYKPLKHLFGEDKPIPPMVSAQLQHWALKLSAYQYKIAHKPGKKQRKCRCLESASTTRVSQGSVIARGDSHVAGDPSIISSECKIDC